MFPCTGHGRVIYVEALMSLQLKIQCKKVQHVFFPHISEASRIYIDVWIPINKIPSQVNAF